MEKTLDNLGKAFIGESQARNRYTIYAKIAKKEGYPWLSDIFLETAEHERQHAKWHFRMIKELKEKMGEEFEEPVVESDVPFTLGSTIENLKKSIEGEHYENSEMYPEFAEVAEEEGLPEIAERLRSIGEAEVHHEKRYKRLLKRIKNGTLYEKDEVKKWTCTKCGYTHEGETPPEECPSCDHPPEYFKLLCEDY